jgi:Holliday junction resolvase RusA-like endonuclease
VTSGVTTIITALPFPISVNAMWADGKTRRIKSKRYEDWIEEAGWELKQQRVIPVRGQVRVHYELQEGRDNKRRDAFNFEKGISDLLVDHGIIEADHDLILRDGRVSWSREVSGARVTIEPWGKE